MSYIEPRPRGQVLWPVTPIEGESLLGLVTRTAHENVLPSSFTLLSRAGQAYGHRPTAATFQDLDQDFLATILGVDLGAVVSRCHAPRDDRGFVDFYGAGVRRDGIITRQRRFSPASLASSPHHRALWMLKPVSFCPESWEFLTYHCHECGAVQRWQSAGAITACDECCADLRAGSPALVPLELRPDLAFLTGLVDPRGEGRRAARDLLPASLAELDGGDIFELAVALTKIVDPPLQHERRRSRSLDPYRHTRALAVSAQIVRGWPDAFVDFLGNTLGSKLAGREDTRLPGLTAFLRGDYAKIVPAAVKRQIEDVARRIVADGSTLPPENIGTKEVAKFLGRNEQYIANARRAGLLKTTMTVRCGKVVPTYCRSEMTLLSQFLRSRVGPEAIAASFGLPQYAVGQLLDLNLLSQIEHPYIVAKYGAFQGSREEAEALGRDIVTAALDLAEIENPLPLKKVMQSIGGGLKPWGTVLKELLTGVRSCALGPGRTLVDQLYISTADASSIRSLGTNSLPSLRSEFCSQRDALEILNLHNRDGRLLQLVAQKRPPAAWQIEWDAIQKIAAEQVSLMELVARTGMHWKQLQRLLDDQGLERIDGFGWDRAQTLAFLEIHNAS